MSEKKRLSRRQFLAGAATAAAGTVLLSACAPPEPEVVVETVKETVEVEVEKEVQVEKIVTATPPPAEPVTIVFWQNNAGWEDMWTEVSELFLAENPEVNFEMVEIPGTDWTQSLLASFVAGTEPDSLWMNYDPMLDLQVKYQPWLPLQDYVEAGLFEAYDMMAQGAIDSMTFGEDILGLPGSNAIILMFYRTDWMEAVGWGTEKPKDFAEWAELATKMTYEDPNETGKDDTYGFVFFGTLARNYCATQLRYLMAAAREEHVKPGELNFNTEVGIEVLKFIQDCIHTYKCSPPDTSTYGHAELYRDVEAGIAGSGRCGTWNIFNWNEWMGEENWTISEYPPLVAGTKPYSIGDYAAVCASRNTKNPDWAAKYCAHLLTKPAQELYFQKAGDTYRSDLDLAALGASETHQYVYNEMAPTLDYIFFVRDKNWAAEEKEILSRHVQACVLDPNADPAAELAAAEKEIMEVWP